jgi:hypothetical protein
MYYLKYVIFSFSIATILSSIGCGKNCKDAKYSFSMDETFSPEKDTITVGDTLWVTSSHSTTFQDLIRNAEVDFSNSQIGSNIGILNFPDTSQTVLGAVNDFTIIKVYGNEVGNDNIPTENRGFFYEEISGNYILKLGFIANQKGVFTISLGNSISTVKRKGGCEKADIEIDNANTNNHLYYYQNFRPGYQISDYERKHMYCFKVY